MMLSVSHSVVECRCCSSDLLVQITLSVNHTVAVYAVTRSESANRCQTPECCSVYVLMLSVSHDVAERRCCLSDLPMCRSREVSTARGLRAQLYTHSAHANRCQTLECCSEYALMLSVSHATFQSMLSVKHTVVASAVT